MRHVITQPAEQICCPDCRQVISSIDRDFDPPSSAASGVSKETATKEKVKVQMSSQLGQLG